ncbi:MAG TPA: hypothetical protein VFQ61_23275 [Polyangiaceae bacterium]|nr:hypothetical protein [Polyangiaceae bacterium]
MDRDVVTIGLRARSLAAAYTLSALAGLWGCAADTNRHALGLASPSAANDRPADSGESAAASAPPVRHDSATERAALDACYAASSAQHPGLSVNSTALYLVRGGKYIYVDFELAEAPELARCIRESMLQWQAFQPPGSDPGAVGVGGRPIRLGPAPTERPAAETFAAHRERWRRVVNSALEKGILDRNDPIVQETLHPKPEWPSQAQRAQLESCYANHVSTKPTPELHLEAIYLARGARVLLADVLLPDPKAPRAPEFAACLAGRIQSWPAPFEGTRETVFSSFFIHLGTNKEEFPNLPASPELLLARRRGLILRAADLRLVSQDDPVWALLNQQPGLRK